jgi:hypothetical protein
MNDQSRIYPHGKVEKISEDIFMVRGSINMNPVVRITRNMAIIREGAELTLVNPLRVSEEVENEILNLGNIAHVMRLGAFHGVDDDYYVDKFAAKMWAQIGGTTYPTPEITDALSAACKLPFENGQVVEFNGSIQPECVLLMAVGNGLLLSCDAIQNYGDYSYNNFLAKLMMPFIGFPKKTIVGPIWLKYMTPEGKSLENQFRNLLDLPFDSLLAAHGTLMTSGAHQAVRDAIDTVYTNNN